MKSYCLVSIHIARLNVLLIYFSIYFFTIKLTKIKNFPTIDTLIHLHHSDHMG